jgi:TonB family protein
MPPRFLLLLGLAGAPLAPAQNVFFALEDGSPPRMVKRVAFGHPLVEIDGKLQGTSAARFSLAHATIYRPGLITLSNFRVQVRHAETMNGGERFNYEISIYGRAKTDVPLKDCFLVLELNAWKNAGCLSVELKDLTPEKDQDLEVTFRLSEPLDEGTYRVHLFSAGMEVLHTKMPARYVAEQKKKTELLLSGRAQDYPPIPSHPSAPVYPPALKAAKVAGSARVKCHLNANGVVQTVELLSATDPAFGAAALAAAPQWKFDPAIKDRHFVAADTEIPFEFRPPR